MIRIRLTSRIAGSIGYEKLTIDLVSVALERLVLSGMSCCKTLEMCIRGVAVVRYSMDVISKASIPVGTM